MLCIPKIADCGGLIIGVDNMEPKIPPFVIVKVPPVISSIFNLPSLAFIARSFILFSILSKVIFSAFLKTGTIKPFSALTAIPMSQ